LSRTLWLILGGLVVALFITIQELSSYYIHKCMAQNWTKESPYRRKTSDMEMLRANSFGYVFGFVFRDVAEFCGFAFSVLSGKTLCPVRRWMWAWLISLIGMLAVGTLWLNDFINAS